MYRSSVTQVSAFVTQGGGLVFAVFASGVLRQSRRAGQSLTVAVYDVFALPMLRPRAIEPWDATKRDGRMIIA